MFLVYKLQVDHRYILFVYTCYRYCDNTSVYIIIGDHYYNGFFNSLNASCMYVYYLFHVCCILCGAIKKKKKKKPTAAKKP